MKLFGTDGIRGRANEYPITAEIALRVGRGVARLLAPAGGTVVIGRDPRSSGPMLEAAVSSGLLAEGANVVLAGVLPTPAVAQLTRSTGAAAGIVLTASHNPHEDNGLKIFGGDGYKLDDALEAALEDFILGAAASPPGGQPGTLTTAANAQDAYLDGLRAAAGNLSLDGMTIVVDAANGAAHTLAPRIFRDLGARVITTATTPDGRNINAGCGALHPEVAAAMVREHHADLGISLDGDADRVIFSDATGTVVSGDRVMAIAALALKERGELPGAAMVCTIMSNLGLHEAMAKAGIRVVTTGVGDRLVIEALRANQLAFGGENSGHLVFAAHATTGDGLLSALQILRMMRDKHAALAELAAGIPEYPQKLLSLNVLSKPPLASLATLQATNSAAAAAFGTLGRTNIRYSGTEAKIRILIEHRDAAVVAAWAQSFTQAVEQDIGIAH
jgi:phosphoglucosamine mutase